MRFICIILTGLFLSSALSLNAQVDDEEPFVFLQYGYASVDVCDKVQDSINKKWNIGQKWVAGCLVTEKLVDSVQKFNLNTRSRLSEKYGEDWEERYSNEYSEACEVHIIALEQSFIDTIERKSGDYVKSWCLRLKIRLHLDIIFHNSESQNHPILQSI